MRKHQRGTVEFMGAATAWEIDDFATSLTAASANTISAYVSDISQFANWVERQSIDDPRKVTKDVVRQYIGFLTTMKMAKRSVGRKVAALRKYFAWLVRERIMTQVIVYDVVDLARWQDLRVRGVIPDAPWFLLFVLGRYTAGQTSNPTDLVPFVHAHTGGEPWAVCAFGATEHACVSAAAALGGHVRVGFENNLKLKDDTLAPDNAALVSQAVDVARCLGRPLATAQDIRQRFAGV